MKVIVAVLAGIFYANFASAEKIIDVSEYTDEQDVIFARSTLPQEPGVIEIFTGLEVQTTLDGDGKPVKVCAILTEEFELEKGEPVLVDENNAPLILLNDKMTYVSTKGLFRMVDGHSCSLFKNVISYAEDTQYP